MMERSSFGKKRPPHSFACFFCLLLFGTLSPEAAVPSRNYAVELTAHLSGSPPEIRLNWRGDQNATAYTISRKLPEEKNWHEIARIGGDQTSFLDRDIQNGVAYEYQVIKETWAGYKGYGYILSGMAVPLVENRGAVLLLVEQTVAAALPLELKILERDLLGDGWEVVRREIGAGESPADVKRLIQAENAGRDGGLSSLFLIGNVPVPYSGDLMPDMHEQHRGAWPADVYYGDLDGAWTDQTVNRSTAERAANHNIPGDGKFDQSEPPSSLELEVGRVDLSRMTSFLNKTPSRNEIDLIRLYLDKNHRFRHGRIPVERQALVFDRTGQGEPEPLAASAWRNFAPFVGERIELIQSLEYLPRVTSRSYLWSAVCSGGGYTSSDMVGTSDVFALNPVNVVFTFFIGSFYGDWDNESNFLRAPLGAAGAVLAVAYSGQPPWICHGMALGQTIGRAARITQENKSGGLYPPFGTGSGEVHIALMGDPTLRAHPVPPPRELTGTTQGNGLKLAWQASPGQDLRGYLVYKRAAAGARFERLTQEPIPHLEIEDPDYSPEAEYMVKAVTVTESLSGSYWNSSQGIFFPDPLAAEAEAVPPAAPTGLVVSSASSAAMTLRWVANSVNQTGYRVERAVARGEFALLADLPGDLLEFTDSKLPGEGAYSYRIAAYNTAGISAYSNVARASTHAASAEFLKLDTTTQGSWKGVYGGTGYHVFGTPPALPPGISITSSNAHSYSVYPTNSDVRFPLHPDGEGRAGTMWVSSFKFSIDLNITDHNFHQVAVYALDFNRLGRPLELEVIDFNSGRVLQKQEVDDTGNGVYLVYGVRGRVLMQFTPKNVYTNGTLFGIFFDRPKVDPIALEGDPGPYFGEKEIALYTPTPGSAIHFTLDGSEPGTSSAKYTGPFLLFESATLQARAFREGFEPSPLLRAEFYNAVVNRAGILKWDDQTRGNWIGAYGREGHWLPSGSRSLSGYAEAGFTGASEWIWNETTADDRATFLDPGGNTRRAAAWFSPDSFSVDISVFDGKSRAVAFYFLDWDSGGREQRVELIRPGGQVVESFALNNFAGGKYLVLNVQGQLQARITKLQGPNAILNGIFFDPAPAGLNEPEPVRLAEPALTPEGFTLRLSTDPGRKVCLDASQDLLGWNCLSTNIVYGGSFEVKDTTAPGRARSYYRVHFVE